jgi:uncharacterized membrane protein YsdA (DUF1294 family)
MNSIFTEVMVILIWNLITFAIMGIDKRRAVNRRYRISESTLFSCAFLFGGTGIICGMYVFRHKTKHWSFKILVPAAVIVNIIAIYFLLQLGFMRFATAILSTLNLK